MTDELFDLTTMAMEYFKEKLEPNLPEITYRGIDFSRSKYNASVARRHVDEAVSELIVYVFFLLA